MVMCARCGRALTWPTSINRGYGPVCWKKKDEALEKKFRYLIPEDVEKEKKLLVLLHKFKNVKVASTGSKNHRVRERYYERKPRSFKRVSDFSYHSYLGLIRIVKENPQNEYIAICFDEWSKTNEEEENLSRMTVSLMEKENPGEKKDIEVLIATPQVEQQIRDHFKTGTKKDDLVNKVLDSFFKEDNQ